MKTILQHLATNWPTASTGFTLIAGSVIHLIFQIRSGSANENSWGTAVTGILGGVGMLVAATASKSNNQSKP